MEIKGWQVSFDNNYSGYVIGLTKKSNGYTLAIRNSYIYLLKRTEMIQKVPVDVANFPAIFAGHLSESVECTKSLKKELTILKKLANLYNMEL